MANTQIRIRRGNPDDPLCNMFRDELRQYVESLPEYKTRQEPAFNDENSMRPSTLPDGSIFLYAETDSTSEPVPVGSICIVILNSSSPYFKGLPRELEQAGEIKRMIVLDEYRQMGVGRKLIEAVEEIAKNEMGLKYMVVETWWALEAAQTLYEKAGYQDREVWGAYMPEDSRCFEKWM